MKIALTSIIILHGLIHLTGFVKAFELSEIKALTLPISKPIGVVWLLAFLLFATVANYRFSTPASNYENIDGYNLCTYGEAIWHYPEEKFVYGKFNVKSVEYNVTKR